MARRKNSIAPKLEIFCKASLLLKMILAIFIHHPDTERRMNTAFFFFFVFSFFLEFNNHTVVQKPHNSSETVDHKINIKVYSQIFVNVVFFLLFGVQ